MNDFDNNDRGGYKNPETVGDYSYAELEEMVLAALDDDNGAGDGRGFRTLSRIKTHAGLERSFDLSPVIEGMQLDKKIRRHNNGNITAYFRYRQKPKRFWLNGDGTVAAEFLAEDDPTPSQISAVEVPAESAAAATKGKAPIAITEERMEEVAAKYTTAVEIAREIGYTNKTSLYGRFKSEPELRDAYDCGRRKFAMRNNPGSFTDDGEPVETDNSPTVRQSRYGTVTDIDARKLEDLAAEYGSKREVAEVLDISFSTLVQKLSTQPGLDAAFKRGYERHWTEIDDKVYVTFGNNSQLLVAFEGNVFTLSNDDLEFLRHIIDLMQAYKAGENAPAELTRREPPSRWQRIKEVFAFVRGE